MISHCPRAKKIILYEKIFFLRAQNVLWRFQDVEIEKSNIRNFRPVIVNLAQAVIEPIIMQLALIELFTVTVITKTKNRETLSLFGLTKAPKPLL
jgi:hypothetical protein